MIKDKLYIQMFSIHGLLRYHNMELGRDADTGGQIKYVIEMAEELSKQPEVARVDLFTRLISDKTVSPDYSVPVEDINDKFRIVRIQCGGKKYIRKELLWPYLDEFIDKTIKFIKRENLSPDIIHGHYADAGYVGMQLAKFFGAPFIFTGHSLGLPKRGRLLNDGMKMEDINKTYKMEHRIFTEEEVLRNADMVVTSTRQEVEKQYGMYYNHELPKYRVIPPGINLEKFYPYYYAKLNTDFKIPEEQMQAKAHINDELNRFFMNPDKPLILALCRADKKKNISGLIDAYGSDKGLQAIANLAIFAGIRKDISDMEESEKNVLTEMLLLMDKYDLYGQMAIPKKHDFKSEVPELYRLAAEKKGVFVNVAMTEPFGLTLIEAAASGLPIVSTNDGGPRDIVKNCRNGILVEPHDKEDICAAIKNILIDYETWNVFSKNGIKGVNEHYNWNAHVRKYIGEIEKLIMTETEVGVPIALTDENPIGSRLMSLQKLLIVDIDNTLVGDDDALQSLKDILSQNNSNMGFGVASGRSIDSCLEILGKYDLKPDIIIASVGSDLFYRNNSFPDKGWHTHISKKWNRDRIKEILDEVDFLEYQEEENQSEFKVSYYMEPDKDRIPYLHDLLTINKLRYNMIYSHGKFLDILPFRASKGKAIQYVSYKWDIPMNRILVSGDSGNDEEMLRGSTLGVVVGNYAEELEKLKDTKGIYFSTEEYAKGIIDGMTKYNFIDLDQKPAGE